MPEPPAFTVVLITKDRPQLLSRSLSQLGRLPERPDVIVLDNASSRSVRPGVRDVLPRARVLSLPANVGTAARNIGVRLAQTELIAFCDDDSLWEPGALTCAEEIFGADARIGLLAARLLVTPEGRDDPVSAQMGRGSLGEDLDPDPQGRRAVTGFLACAALVRARAFLGIGGFPAKAMIGGEEQTVAWELWANGWKALYAPEVCAVHAPPAQHPGPGRRRITARNDLWAAWERLPLPQLGQQTGAVARRSARDPAAVAGVVDAIRGLRAAAAGRAPLPAKVGAAFAATRRQYQTVGP